MKDKIVYEKIYNHLKTFIIHSNWIDNNTPEQARAFFTTLCFICDISADTSVCDNMLLELYNDAGIEYTDISYNDFENFMVELIV